MDIEKLAKGAKLNLQEEEQNNVLKVMNLVLDDFFSQDLKNAQDWDTLVSAKGAQNVSREDVATQDISREELLEHIVEEQDGHIVVPKTLGG